MEIMRAIERADALCPNPYTTEEKLLWCDEVTASLRRNVIKIYDVITSKADKFGRIELPDDIPFERVEVLRVGKDVFGKRDFRSFKANKDLKKYANKKLEVVYLSLPNPIRQIEIRGTFNTDGDVIEMDEPPFCEGDLIEIIDEFTQNGEPISSSAKTAFVMEADASRIILDRCALTSQTDAELYIRRVINDVTEIDEAPYDSMYIEYILSKIALYQHDYVSYNAHMTQYNSLYAELIKEYKARNPLSELVRFRNYSIL